MENFLDYNSKEICFEIRKEAEDFILVKELN